ncbi:hypothetical protein [Dubosiella newyorkensis]|uniref:hypothetical protein n=1 Tax=Dubosiella newyorkensis TaxID=1862672 RepID=UPI00272AA174|nr:hypothetical protein [Dubosiella newyorkensis]
MSEKNAGYEILHSINLNGEFGIVLGENKNAIEGYQFVTWINNSRGYDQGCYFSDKKQAYVSLLERIARTIGVDLENYYFQKSAFEDIEAIMNTIPSVTMEQAGELMKDERFKSIAYHQFLHSENAEDLQYRLENEYNKYISNEESNEENKIEEQEEIEP